MKLFLERDAELMIAGNRPPAYGKIRIAGKKDGAITGWQSFCHLAPPATCPLPYIIDRSRTCGSITPPSPSIPVRPAPGARPTTSSFAYLTCSAIEDFAAKVGMDPMDVFKKAVQFGPKARVDQYKYQLDKAAELSDWKKLWKPRGASSGSIKRGLGIGISAWGGGGHNSNCRTTINPDGSVLVEIGTQDLGTGTRTIIVQVAAESLGLPMSKIKLAIGSNDLPPDAASGGSTTVGGVTVSTRQSTVNALAKLFEVAAPALGAQPEDLEAVDGHIRVKGNPTKASPGNPPARKSGLNKISEMGTFNRRQPAPGPERPGRRRACRLPTFRWIPKPASSKSIASWPCTDWAWSSIRAGRKPDLRRHHYGHLHGAHEERFFDAKTGKYLNADMELYKLAGIGDIGDIMVHLDIRPENDKRGVIGLGEPCAVAICAAVGNAVTNAIGVRVPNIPMTPIHVINALEGRIA